MGLPLSYMELSSRGSSAKPHPSLNKLRIVYFTLFSSSLSVKKALLFDFIFFIVIYTQTKFSVIIIFVSRG